MNSVQGLKEISGILSKTPEGTKILNDLKRFKLDKIVGDGLVDSTTQQVKYGTFSKLLEKGKNKEIVRELLGSQGFKRLERLQRNSGRLAESANKFLNASQSGVVAADAAIIGKLLADLGHILTLNPWPLIKTTSGLIGARKLNKLLSDPDFLKSVEDVILASEKGSPTHLQAAIKNIMAIIDREGLRAYLLEGLKQSKND
jgi:hypothetical protein